MKQVILKSGKAEIEETPRPLIEYGTILVSVDHSCISAGTEVSGLKMSGKPLWKRALAQPDNVKKALQMLSSHGFSRTKSLISGRLAAGNATGYSAAGTVIEVGEDISDLKIGDRVACAGAQCAHHAEIIRVPRNLAVKIPKKVSFADASTVTLGAIALQGVRRANPTLGETVVVIGLGILGQITSQLLKANGCVVIGMDLDEKRVDLAKSLGMDSAITANSNDPVNEVYLLSDGVGADSVIVTAATPSNDLISTAFKMCRKKGRVILVGDVGLNLNRGDLYQKELDFFISCSYGPGRYDGHYEEDGLEYPISYVRWTENRNMSAYLRLIEQGRIQITPLVGKIFDINHAPLAYEMLSSKDERPLIVLLSYPKNSDALNLTKVLNPKVSIAKNTGKIKIALVGAGGFAKGMHLPNLSKLTDRYHLQAIMSRTGHNASATAKQFGANYGTSNFKDILNDSEIDAVIIATRHNLHTDMVLRALDAGKHVLVEKPLSLTQDELNHIRSYYEKEPSQTKPILLTGFNRRFSPHLTPIYEHIKNRNNPIIINYQLNAGYIPLDHWVHGNEGGGRNIGEACHFYDVFTYLTNSKIDKVQAVSISPTSEHYSRYDNFMTQISFADGSIASLTYTAIGSKKYPKEDITVFCDGSVLHVNDFRSLKSFGAKVREVQTKTQEKGQMEELIAFADSIQQGKDWPIPLWQQIQNMEICFEVEKYLKQNIKK